MQNKSKTPPSEYTPDVLYHYTTPQGLLGVLQSRSLWATDTNFLNDARELQFGRIELQDALLARAEALCPGGENIGSAEASKAGVMRSAAQYLAAGAIPEKTRSEPVYVTCFCEHRDLLSQWRGYGIGGGYALGFATAALSTGLLIDTFWRRCHEDGTQGHTLEAASKTTPALVQVQYGTRAVARMVQDVLETIAPYPTGHPGATGWAQAVRLAVPALAGVKHEAFSEEREWRLLVAGDVGRPEEGFRVTPLGIVPFVALHLDLGASLKEIIVGPGTHEEVRALGVLRLLQHLGLDHVTVRASETPYRS